MYYSLANVKRFYYVVSILFLFLLTQGCAIKLVADYDAQVAQAIIKASKQVDQFYGDLLETRESKRSYKKYKKQYIQIEVNIRALVMQNTARPLNDESISIAETILKMWVKYKLAHKDQDGYKTVLAVAHRTRFTRLFTAMAVAENAKKMDTE